MNAGNIMSEKTRRELERSRQRAALFAPLAVKAMRRGFARYWHGRLAKPAAGKGAAKLFCSVNNT